MKILLAVFYAFAGLYVLTLADGTFAMGGRPGVSGFLGSGLAFTLVGLVGTALALIVLAFYQDG